MSVSKFEVLMRVTVSTLRHRVMNVKMVAVVVGMGVFMRQRFIVMQMAMCLGQMQQDARQHDAAADRHAPAQRAIAQRNCQQPADEGREGEHRSRACRAERPSTPAVCTPGWSQLTIDRPVWGAEFATWNYC